MTKKIIYLIAGCIAAVALVLLALHFKPQAPVHPNDKPVVRIALILPMTGDAGIYGQVAQKVSDMFLSDFRAAHPDAKYNYEVLCEDAQLSAQKAVLAFKRLHALYKLDAVGGIFSSFALAINPTAEQEKVIQLVWAVDPRAGAGDYNLRMSSNVNVIAKKIADKLVRDGSKKVAVVIANETANIVYGEAFVNELAKRDGIKIVGKPHYFNPGERDFRILLYKIKNAGADTIVLMSLPPENGIFIRQAREIGLNLPITGFQTINTVSDKTLVEGMWNYDHVKADPAFAQRVMRIANVDGTYYSEYIYGLLSVLTAAFEAAPANAGAKPVPLDVVKTIPVVAKGMKTPFGTLDVDENGEILFPPLTLQKIVNGASVTIDE
ncbi:MAG: ABC transporter substrate-binding protein [Alphaproteobacteria bacterium]|nr:ABC transporter substrate-binding protein [Alphaproteobacteria bacterium]